MELGGGSRAAEEAEDSVWAFTLLLQAAGAIFLWGFFCERRLHSSDNKAAA